MTIPEWAYISHGEALYLIGVLTGMFLWQSVILFRTQLRLWRTEQELQQAIASSGHGCDGSTQPTEETQ